MKLKSRSRFVKTVAVLALASQAFLPVSSYALNLADGPLFITNNSAISPMVMLDLSKDHQLYYKAYNDYSDLDGDGQLDTTYKHSIDYYGYFDPHKCYAYSAANNRFEPKLVTGDKYCTPGKGLWSGNFLNWVAMSRMDAVRKLLYGGYRSTDTATDTVLERAYLPTDAHAWAKYYNGSDIDKLTPFSAADGINATPPTASSGSSLTLGTGDKTFTTSLTAALGDQVKAEANPVGSGRWMVGWVTGVGSGKITIHVNEAQSVSGSGSFSSWTLTNLSNTGISFCNLTKGSSSGVNRYSDTNGNPPIIRVARGNYALWSANERWQCYWREEKSSTQFSFNGGIPSSSNGNKAVLSGIAASAENPSQSERGLGTGSDGSGSKKGEYVARIEVCVSAADANGASLLGTERCKLYPSSSTYKPIGLLQVYGDSDLMRFGLITGSYNKNISGGVLRKNVGPMSDEVNTSTGISTNAQGIMKTINSLRMYGYDYNDGTYIGRDGCYYQQIGIVHSGGATAIGKPANEGNCSTWGNPISEIYLESLRYYAGKQPTSDFNVSGTDKLNGLQSATWKDPLSNDNYCSPLNVIVFNASSSSYDRDQMGGLADLGATQTAAQLTKQVGDGEDITGNSFFVGNNGQVNDNLCSAKTIGDLGAVYGICPEAPSVEGSYLIDGAAWYAHTHRIRSDLTVPGTDTKSLKVNTYAVQLATSTPKIVIPVPGKPGQTVTILPAYRLDVSSNGSGPFGSGTVVDFKVVSQDLAAGTGKFYINWDDSQQGGDYDQDVWGVIEYSFPDSSHIRITTDAVAASSANGQGFGYVISGTTQDGAHFHSGSYGFDYTDQTNVAVTGDLTHINTSGGCSNCVVGDGPTTVTYTLSSSGNLQGNFSQAQSLQDPLWYAAKWGGFTDLNGNGKPDLAQEWDVKTASGTDGTDGVPDNYFFVNNPLGLESALEKTFNAILAVSSASSVATNSTSLNTGSKIYQAKFNSNDWSGQLLSFSIDFNGVIATNPDWDAELPTDRVILTYDDDNTHSTIGIPFRWANLTASEQTALNTNESGVFDGRGSLRLDWLRGDSSQEGDSATSFRKRPNSKLGDIVNSNPVYVAAPNAGFPDPDYASFRQNYLDRKPVIYVGANDGMLHGFDASANPDGTPTDSSGKEVLAYVPSKVYKNLSLLTAKNYVHHYYVDGTPAVADAKVNGFWKTVLVGSLNHGGQGLFALDVTDPRRENFSEANAGNLVLWEFTDANDPDLGYTYGTPQIAQMANGKWAVIVGNGYNNTEDDGNRSATGHAALFILFLDRSPADGKTWTLGTHYIKIDTGVGTPADPNGLATPFPADVDGDGKVDYIYAGDLKGNMWKFDVTSPTPSNWKVAFSKGGAPTPLFTALDNSTPQPKPQPITSSPEVMKSPNGGYMVLFGTGIYVQPTDPNPQYQVQTFYGIWDKCTKGDAACTPTPVSGRPELKQQTILTETTQTGGEFRITSANSVDYKTQRGWFMDLLDTPTSDPIGERVVYPSLIRSGRVVFNTLIPSSKPCERGGTSWLMELDAVTGSRLLQSPFDVNADTYFSSADLVSYSGTYVAVSGVKSTIGITPTPTVIGGGPGTTGSKKEFKVMSGSSGGTASVAETAAGTSGRLSWREILHQ